MAIPEPHWGSSEMLAIVFSATFYVHVHVLYINAFEKSLQIHQNMCPIGVF